MKFHLSKEKNKLFPTHVVEGQVSLRLEDALNELFLKGRGFSRAVQDLDWFSARLKPRPFKATKFCAVRLRQNH